METWTSAIPEHHRPDFTAVRAVWQGMRSGNAIPARADLNPMALGDALPICFLAERMPHHGGRFRLVGRDLNDAYDMDLRSIPLPALVAPPLQQTLVANMDCVFDHGRLLFAQYSVPQAAQTRSLLLQPLQDSYGRTNLALGIAAGFSPGAALGELTIQTQCALLPVNSAAQDAKAQEQQPTNVVALSTDRPVWTTPAQRKGTPKPGRPKLHVVR